MKLRELYQSVAVSILVAIPCASHGDEAVPAKGGAPACVCGEALPKVETVVRDQIDSITNAALFGQPMERTPAIRCFYDVVIKFAHQEATPAQTVWAKEVANSFGAIVNSQEFRHSLQERIDQTVAELVRQGKLPAEQERSEAAKVSMAFMFACADMDDVWAMLEGFPPNK